MTIHTILEKSNFIYTTKADGAYIYYNKVLDAIVKIIYVHPSCGTLLIGSKTGNHSLTFNNLEEAANFIDQVLAIITRSDENDDADEYFVEIDAKFAKFAYPPLKGMAIVYLKDSKNNIIRHRKVIVRRSTSKQMKDDFYQELMKTESDLYQYAENHLCAITI